MSEIFLFYKLKITSGRNMFYLHFLIDLISSKKYWRVAKNSVLILKEVIQVKICFCEIPMNIQAKEERLNFLKPLKTRFREKFEFGGLCVSLK